MKKRLRNFLVAFLVLLSLGFADNSRLEAQNNEKIQNAALAATVGLANHPPSNEASSSLIKGSFQTELAAQSRQLGAGDTEEAATPLQQAFKQSIEERKALGLPGPSSVSYESEVVPGPSIASRAEASASPVHQFKLIYRTSLHFDSPKQAGQDKWPDLVVEEKTPPKAKGFVKAGDYTKLVREAIEKAQPGIGKQYEFGYEPRTFIFEETYEVFSSGENSVTPQVMSAPPATSDQILFGFTNTFQYNYSLDISEEFAGTGVTIWAKALLTYGWGAGIRLPVTVTLTSPVNTMFQESTYTLTSSITSANWNEEIYNDKHVPAFGGKELVLEAHFLVHVAAGIKGPGLDFTLFDWQETRQFDVGQYGVPQDFSTPFGDIWYPPNATAPNTGLEFDLSPEQTGFYVKVAYYKDPIFGNVLADVDLGLGFIVNVGLGSTSIKADWQAEGNASGSGEINYSTNGGTVGIGPVAARDFGSAQDAYIHLTNFRYHPSLLFRLSGYLCAKGEVLGNKKNCDDLNTRNNPIKIYEVDFQPDVEPLRIHPGTQDSIVLNIPVTSPIHIEKTANEPVVSIGDTVTITTTVTNIGQTDLTQVKISDNGEDVLDCPGVLGTCTYVRTLTATKDDDLASVTEVTATLVREDKEVQVRSTQTKFIPVLNGIVGNGTPVSCNEAALDAELYDYTRDTITFNCGGPATIVISTTKTISRDITIKGSITNTITIDGGSSIDRDNAVRVFYVKKDATLNLQNLTVADGIAHRKTSTATLEAGGGIYNLGTVNLDHTLVTGNEADQGGGIHNKGILTITGGCQLAGNTATIVEAGDNSVATGGAIYNDGTLTITDSTIGGDSDTEGNQADGGGGGVLNWTASNAPVGTVEIINSTIANNWAGNGGGIENGAGGVVTITNTPIRDNRADWIGGGIANFETGRIVISNSSLSDNIATQGGGIQNKGVLGIQVDLNNNDAILPGTTFLSNNQAVSSAEGTALDGGAIYNDGTLKIAHATIESNSARGGGGIINWSGGTLDITDTTIANNQAGNGGGIENGAGGVLTIADTQIHNNEAISIGGGIINYETGRIIISSSNISSNIATQGGGIHNKGVLGIQININNNDTILPGASTLSGNKATSLDGGAIYNDGTLKIANSTIGGDTEAEGNTARGGGGILNWGNGQVEISTCEISGNSADNGGGIENGANGTLIINNNSTITRNSATFVGGGIVNYDSGVMEISDTTIADNSAQQNGDGIYVGGGGIYNFGSGRINIADSQLAHNKAIYGAGVRNQGIMTVTNITLTGNEAMLDSGGEGGGIYNEGSSLKIISSTFSDNKAVGGGAILNWAGGHVEIDQSTLSNNIASLSGGGLENGEQGTVVISASSIISNTAGGEDEIHGGGGIRNFGGTVTIDNNSEISNNSALRGGGIYNSDTLNLTDCTLSNNIANLFPAGGKGGGIYNIGTVTLSLCVLNNNSATGSGGGARGGGIYNNGTLTLTDSTVSNNSAGSRVDYAGGGIYNESGQLTLTRCTLSSNSLTGYYLGDGGGGLYNGSGEANLTNCTISGNSVHAGDPAGGIYSEGALGLTNCTVAGNSGLQSGGIDGQAILKNTIVANNTAHPGSGDCGSSATITSEGYNLDSDGSCGLNGPGDLPNTDPRLGPLADNGGTTLTHALLPDSPAINHIPTCVVTTDQRGEPRPGLGSSRCDIGAFEFQDVPDGTVGTGGGIVGDTAGTGAEFSVGAGALAEMTDVFIEVVPDPTVSLPPGLATAFVDIVLEPTPDFSGDTGATISLPMSPDSQLAQGDSLSLFVYDPDNQTLIDTHNDGVVQNGVAVFHNVTQFSTFVGSTNSAVQVKRYLTKTDLSTAYNPNDPRAPAGVFTLAATFQNSSSTPLNNLFFEVDRLTGGNLVLNAYGGPGGAGAVVPVPYAALGPDGRLDPGESFAIDFELGLAVKQRFAFSVAPYGIPIEGDQVGGLSQPEADEGNFQFEIEEGQLQVDQGQMIYLPIIIK